MDEDAKCCDGECCKWWIVLRFQSHFNSASLQTVKRIHFGIQIDIATFI